MTARLEVIQAGRHLRGRGLVLRRRAPDRCRDVHVAQPQPIIRPLRRGEVCVAGAVECGHQEALTLEFPHLKDRICLLTAFAGLHPSDIPDPVKYDLPTAFGILTDLQDCVQRAAERLNSGNSILFAQNYY